MVITLHTEHKTIDYSNKLCRVVKSRTSKLAFSSPFSSFEVYRFGYRFVAVIVECHTESLETLMEI